LVLALKVMRVAGTPLESSDDFSSSPALLVLIKVCYSGCGRIAAEESLKAGRASKRKRGGAAAAKQVELGLNPAVNHYDVVDFAKGKSTLERPRGFLGRCKLGDFIRAAHSGFSPCVFGVRTGGVRTGGVRTGGVRTGGVRTGTKGDFCPLFSNFVEIDTHSGLEGGP
jgi:hypothetical protein